jgi:hypothetical protein
MAPWFYSMTFMQDRKIVLHWSRFAEDIETFIYSALAMQDHDVVELLVAHSAARLSR